MPRSDVAGGVCLSCKFDPDCAFEADRNQVILQCEQFAMDVREPLVREPFFDERKFQEMMRGQTQSSEFPGLCANCDHRETCVYPKPEGGVWRCEEYA